MPAIPAPAVDWPGDDETAVNVVALNFDWPDDLRLRLTRSVTNIASVGGKTTTSTNSFSHLLSVTPVPEGLQLTFSDTHVETPDVQLTDQVRTALDGSVAAMTALGFPSVIVSRDARFLHLANPAQVEADFRAMIDIAKLGGIENAGLTPAQSAADPVASRQSIERLLSTEWQISVGTWQGVTMKTGVARSVTIAPSDPEKKPSAASFTGAARLVGRTACDAADAAKSCVALEMVLRADPAQLTAALKAEWDARRPAMTVMQVLTEIEKANREMTFRLVTEPTTLLPRYSQTVTRTVVEFKVLGGGPSQTLRSQNLLEVGYRPLAP